MNAHERCPECGEYCWPLRNELNEAEAECARLRGTVEQLTAALPTTFFADRPIEERVRLMVDTWNRAILANNELDEEAERLRAALVAASEETKP